jgi:hypothetical protein
MGSRCCAQREGWLLPALLVAVLLVVPAPGAAQEPVKSFDQINTRLKVGDTVWVTDAQGRELKGKITSFGPDALVVDSGGTRTLPAADVRLILERPRDSFKNGTLIGLGVGAGFGVIVCASFAEGSQDAGWCALAIGAYGGIGGAVGLGIDALIPGKKLVAYRAPGSAGSSHTRLSIAPVITPRAKGVAVSFAY